MPLFGSFVGIETLINRALSFDARTPERLARLKGKKLLIEFSDAKLSALIQFSAQGLHFSKPLSETIDASVQGSLTAFLSLLLSKDIHVASRLGLLFEGDLQTAEDSQSLLLNLQIDWEEILSRFMGDTIASALFTLVKKGQAQHKAILDNFSLALRDYLQEETRVLPTRSEVDLFLDEVDELNLQIDRIAARLTQIEVTEETPE